jgi:acetyl esterase/lipase
MKLKLVIFLLSVVTLNTYSQVPDTIYLWPGPVPGEAGPKSEPVLSPNNDRGVERISEVTNPDLIVFPAKAGEANGAAVIVSPGGGYNILAIDLEGIEIAKWLNSLGYTAFVLEYRVPRKRDGALQDLQRAIRIVRSRADEWKLDPDKIGVMGFSAGGSLSARAETRYNERTYKPVDKTDSISCRPSFGVLIYPAYLDEGPGHTLTPELNVNKDTPPTFLFATADDHYSNSVLIMAGALRGAKVPVELHLMPTGGHGYGLRKGNPAAEKWPGLAADWMAKTLKDL